MNSYQNVQMLELSKAITKENNEQILLDKQITIIIDRCSAELKMICKKSYFMYENVFDEFLLHFYFPFSFNNRERVRYEKCNQSNEIE